MFHTVCEGIVLDKEYFRLGIYLPLRVFPVTGAYTILPGACPSVLLSTCPYHFRRFSVTLFVTAAAFTDPLTCSCLVLADTSQ